jgi:hypothetical protein
MIIIMIIMSMSMSMIMIMIMMIILFMIIVTSFACRTTVEGKQWHRAVEIESPVTSMVKDDDPCCQACFKM